MLTKIAVAAFAASIVSVTGASASLAQDVAEGEKIFKRLCAICHVVDKGSTVRKQGPNLWGIVGRTAGTIEGFKYSDANRTSGIVWSAQTLDPYLESPRTVIPGTTMAFVGIKKPEERKAMIEYLMSLK